METLNVNSAGASMPGAVNRAAWNTAALATAPLRMVAGWLFLSAFIRRFINAPEKMNPDAIGYVGEKFNHFMPHAVAGQKEMIEWLLAHPSYLHLFLVIFSVLEALCGLGLLTGTLTRLSALGIFLMSYGVLTGAGWLGSTCLDEWQIGSLGMAGSLAIIFTGAGQISMDQLLLHRINKPWLKWITSGPLFNTLHIPRNFSIGFTVTSIIVVVIMLATYQAFFNGLWGKLHNHSVKPEIEISQVTINPTTDEIMFRIYRSGGPDTYGAFIIKGRLKDAAGAVIGEISADQLSRINSDNIANEYLVKVQSKTNALLVPLGGAATVSLSLPHSGLASSLELEDISGLTFHAPVKEYK